MLEAIVTLSLRHRWLVVAAWAAIAAAGAWSFLRLEIDAFPDTTPVQVQVNTTAPALSPLEIERSITAPVEAALSGLPGLVEVRSISKFGLSQVTLVFEDGADLWLARQVVSERTATVRLPSGVDPPALGPVATGLGEVFHYLVTGEASLAELRAAQDWIVKPRLRAVPGVAEVNTWGGEERRVEVLVDPADLHRAGLSLAQLVDALEGSNGNVGGGSLDVAGERTLVQGVGVLTSLRDVEDVVVASRAGVALRVRDVARVVDGAELRTGAVTADGEGEAVLGLGFLLIGENSHDVTRRLELRLDEIRDALPDGVRVEAVYERTTLVDAVLRTVETNLVEGALLVVAVLFVFLGNARAGLIVAAVIPASMLFAGNLMLQVGVAGSLMSLGAIDFGLIVDSAIIVVENAVRRLARAEPGADVAEVVREAAVEVRTPTLFGEVILLVVYLPILTLEGVEGKLFRPMALTVVFALLGSMLASLTLVPALASLGLRAGEAERDTLLVRGLRRAYRPVLRGAMRAPAAVLAFAALLVANAAFLSTRLGSEFVPRLGEGTIVANTVRLASVSLDESVRYATRIERTLLATFPDEIERVWTRTGTAEIATDPMGVELSDVFVALRPRERWTRADTQDELVAAMQVELSTLPGMRVGFTQPIEMRVNEMLAGVRSDVAVKLFGDDLDGLARKAREIARVLEGIDGASEVVTEQATGVPTVQVTPDPRALGRQGLRPREVLDTVAALGGIGVGELQEGGRRVPIAVRLAPELRTDPERVGRLLVTGANGDRVALARVADVAVVEGPSTVQREWGQRRAVVQVNVRGRDVGSFVAEADRAIRERVDLPDGWFHRFGGQFESYVRARNRLAIVVPVAAGLVFSLLWATYGRVLDAARVFTGVPFAAVGGIAALWLRGLPLSVPAGVGFVALAGISVLADMVMVSTIQRNLGRGLELREAVEAAALERLRPVLMTALVASLGFVPMALNTGIGAEVQRPLATVVIGGLASSTLLTLVVLPVLYTVARRHA
jgi:cobalt-zinc-cadmium resistance protein CzcA